MKIEFDLSDEKDVEYACRIFEKFAQLLPLPKVARTNVLTEDSFVAALQYIAFHTVNVDDKELNL